jgi:hypothetical protein
MPFPGVLTPSWSLISGGNCQSYQSFRTCGMGVGLLELNDVKLAKTVVVQTDEKLKEGKKEGRKEGSEQEWECGARRWKKWRQISP